MVIRPPDGHSYCAQSVFNHLGLWRKLYDSSGRASLHSQPMCPKMGFVDIVVISNRLTAIWERAFSTPTASLWMLEAGGGQGIR